MAVDRAICTECGKPIDGPAFGQGNTWRHPFTCPTDDRVHTTLDDIAAVRFHYDEARAALGRLHAAASDEGGMTGPLRDALFGINTMLDAVMALAGVDQIVLEYGPEPTRYAQPERPMP